MKYIIVWRIEGNCGIMNRNGRTPLFKTKEEALAFAIKEAEKWAKNGGFNHQDSKKMKINAYPSSPLQLGRVYAYDIDDCRNDNWKEYMIDKIITKED